MQAQSELEYISLIVQDYIATLPRAAQIALAERAQHCVNTIQRSLEIAEGASKTADATDPV